MVEQSNRKILKGKEIDIFIPERNFGIEFNGLYWHSEDKGKHKNYHYNKWTAANTAGIQLIQIWEDDWMRNPELIKSLLEHKLGLNEKHEVEAIKARVVQLTENNAKQFMNKNHIQGFVVGDYYVGLKTNDTNELVSAMVIKKEIDINNNTTDSTDDTVINDPNQNTLTILRYATQTNVSNGFKKLLTHVEETFLPKQITAVSDNAISNGELYENNGFIVNKEIPPDYMYVVKHIRKPRRDYKLKRFREDLKLKYIEGLTEKELAELNNIPRIWDAGKTRWVKTVKPTNN